MFSTRASVCGCTAVDVPTMPIGHQSLPAQQLHSSAAPSIANVNTACAYPPPVHDCVCVCVQYDVTQERSIALMDANRSTLAAHSTSLHLPPSCALFHVCVQYAVTKERIIALIDADRAMLQTLAEGVGANGGEAAVAASSVHSSCSLSFKQQRHTAVTKTAV